MNLPVTASGGRGACVSKVIKFNCEVSCMDFLNQIWSVWNEHWAANVATVLSIIAIVWSAGDKFHRMTSAIRRWKGWAILLHWCRSAERKFRIRRAKGVMRSKLALTGIRISIRDYESCLAENSRTSGRNTLSPITPEKPAWLNDYYVATALEALSREEKIVKAKTFDLKGFPPSPEMYLFRTTKAGITAEQQVDEIETEGMCLVHQFFQQCLEAPRYEIGGRAETTAPGTTQFTTLSRLREDAPPCSRCWEVEDRRNNIRLLVDGITRHDLAATATSEITGTDREFQEAVIAICIERQCVAEVATVKKIVERAIEIRRSQLCHLPTDHKMDWTEELTKEFTACLHEYIKTEVQ